MTAQTTDTARPYRPSPRPSPDQEAFDLLVRLAERALVARSFARICAGLVQERALRASDALRIAELGRFARAATTAAATVAATEVRRAVSAAASSAPESDRKPNLPNLEKKKKSPPAPADDEDAPSSLDHEALHDDAC